MAIFSPVLEGAGDGCGYAGGSEWGPSELLMRNPQTKLYQMKSMPVVVWSLLAGPTRHGAKVGAGKINGKALHRNPHRITSSLFSTVGSASVS